jgi:Integrase core domain
VVGDRRRRTRCHASCRSRRGKPTAPASPWQNGFAERLIGSIRRECLDHIVVLGEAHLRQILRSYARYYNDIRTHRSSDKDAPAVRPVQRAGSLKRSPFSAVSITTTSGVRFSVRTACSRLSTRRSMAVWGWACRSAGRSSKRTAADCGRARTCPAAPAFNSPCRRSQTLRREWNAASDQRRGRRRV